MTYCGRGLSNKFSLNLSNISFSLVSFVQYFYGNFVFSYIQYSSIAARIVRQALKEPAKAEALKREGAQVRITNWKDGKAISKFD